MIRSIKSSGKSFKTLRRRISVLRGGGGTKVPCAHVLVVSLPQQQQEQKVGAIPRPATWKTSNWRLRVSGLDISSDSAAADADEDEVMMW